MKSNHKSTNETGDIKNLENLLRHIKYCKSLEPIYNPTNDEILSSDMNKHHIKATGAFEDLRTKRINFILITNQRQDAFDPIRKLATRLNGAIKGGGYDQKTIDDFITISKKIQGRLSKPKTNEKEPNQELQRAVSNSQQSYDQLIDNLAEAVRYLEKIKDYNPNEEDLQIPALNDTLNRLRAVNQEYFDTFIPFSKALEARDKVFYDQEEGFIQKVMTSRQYLQSIYGFSSPEHKFARSITFRTFKRKK